MKAWHIVTVEDQGDFEMARDNTEPAYTAPAGTEADATGTRTAETTDQGQVTEAQADQSQTQETGTEQADTSVEAAQKQAEEDAKAMYEARNADGSGYVAREANPEVGGESFPSFAPPKK